MGDIEGRKSLAAHGLSRLHGDAFGLPMVGVPASCEKTAQVHTRKGQEESTTVRRLILALPASLATVALAHAQGQGLRKVTVDAASAAGTLRPLQGGVNGAPGPGGHKPEYFTFGGWNMPGWVDASTGYRWARIDLVRTHDAYGPTDIDARFETAQAPGGALIHADRDAFTIFPDPHADPESPASYRFGPSDRIIASIEGIGAQVLYRLGRSEGADPTPPPDFTRYAEIARHIVLHYNRGWDRGFHYGIRYWEIWNEPDLGKVFWSGTPQQYFELYGRLARAVKAADPQALVGGPAIADPNAVSPYRDGFLDYVKAHHLPLDFYSWHWYATDSYDPLDFSRIAETLRRWLDAHGMRHTRSFLTEWNDGLVTPPPSPLVRAAFITAARIYMQDAPIDAATLYRADNVFGRDGKTPDKTGQALIALGRMQETRHRLAVQGDDRNGFAVLAGRSADGRLVQVLIVNYQIPQAAIGPRKTDNVLHTGAFNVHLLSRRTVHYHQNAGFDLTIEHLQPARYLLERCRITDHDDFSAADSVVTTSADIHVAEPLPPPGVELLRVQRLLPRERIPSGSVTWCRAAQQPR